MRTSAPVADPWATDLDNGWRELVVSSAPAPTPRPPALESPKARKLESVRSAFDPPTRESFNPTLPSDLHTWQEHGAPPVAVAADEPSFSAGDRRLWVVAGTLMAMAALVLGLLGVLTFGHGYVVPAAIASSSAVARPVEPAATNPPQRAIVTTRVISAAPASASASAHASKHSKHAKHHKKLATADTADTTDSGFLAPLSSARARR